MAGYGKNHGGKGGANLIPWIIQNRKELLSVEPWLTVWREEVQLPDGRVVPDYYHVGMRDSVSTVALTPKGQVLAGKEYRHGPRSQVWVLPAGYLEPGEEPAQAAQRELLEETGFTARKWIPLGQFIVDINRGCGRIHLFLALEAFKSSEPVNHDLQDFPLQMIGLNQLIKELQSGPIQGLAAVASLYRVRDYLSKTGIKYE